MIGITAYGAYLPRARLQKQVIADANAWFDSGLRGLAKGEKAMCNWDEDSITMATEAFSDAMGRAPGQTLAAVILASTSLPFADRQNSVVLAEAMNLDTTNLRTMDVTCSQRASTSALLSALDVAAAGHGDAVVVASSTDSANVPRAKKCCTAMARRPSPWAVTTCWPSWSAASASLWILSIITAPKAGITTPVGKSAGCATRVT